MNRIILIGNGFDLAHQLPTGFPDFLNYYWKNIIQEIMSREPFTPFENDDIIIEKVPMSWSAGSDYDTLRKTLSNFNSKIRFKNILLQIISEHSSIHKWVDIENEYYLLLKDSFKNDSPYYNDINDLNSDFNRIKLALEDYITEIENNFELKEEGHKNQIGYKVYSRCNFVDFAENAVNERAEIEYKNIKEILKNVKENKIGINQLSEEKQRLISRLRDSDDIYLAIRKLLLSQSAPNYFDLFPKNVLFLNFNYTNVDKHYYNSEQFDNYDNVHPKSNSIHIHGSVHKYDYNPYNFWIWR